MIVAKKMMIDMSKILCNDNIAFSRSGIESRITIARAANGKFAGDCETSVFHCETETF